MADRTETLLFLVDVQVRNAKALRELDADFAAAARAHERRLAVLSEAATAGSESPGPAAVAEPVIPVTPPRRGEVGILGGPAGAGETFAGARGKVEIGSRQNPMIIAQESGQYAGLGALAAATGAQSADQGPPTVAPTAAPAPGADVAAALQDAAALRRAISARPEQLSLFSGAAGALQSAAGGEQVVPVPASSRPEAYRQVGQAFADALAAARAPAGSEPTTVPVMLSTAQAASRLGISRTRVYDLAGGGQLVGAQKSSGQWSIPEQAAIDLLASGGGPGLPNLPTARGGGGDQGGGANNNNGLLRRLLWGTGFLGLAGMGTVGSLAGFDPAHIVTTLLAVAGSAASGVAGAGLLGLGTAGTMAIGGGADVLATRTAATNVKTLNTDLNNLSQAVAVYGKNSTQAGQAQKQLNYDLQRMGAAAGPALQTANQLQALDNLWAQASVAAQGQAQGIFRQGLTLATQYAPMVAQAAQRNLTIIDTGLKPLFAWLEGPHGIGIFQNLENNFAHNLPTAVHAFTQGVELLLRVTSLASNYTGGFTRMLDRLFTRLNSLSDQQLNSTIGRLIGDFRMWETLIKLLIEDIYQLFHNDAGTGQGIVLALTGMLQKLHEWETSTQGRTDLHNIFVVHKAEVLALLQLLPLLVSGFGSFYLRVAPALTTAATAALTVIDAVLRGIEALGPAASTLLGFALVAAKLGVLGTVLRGIASALGLISARAPAAASGLSAVDAAAAGGGAAAGAGAAAATGTEGAALGLTGVGALGVAQTGAASVLPYALAAGGGLLAGSSLQSVTGLRGGTGGTLAGGLIGGGLGLALSTVIGPLGPVLGTLLGSGIGSTIGPTIGHLLSSLFGSGAGVDYGKRFASGFMGQFQGIVTKQVGQQMRKTLKDAYDQLTKATSPVPTSISTRGVTYGTPAGVPHAQYHFGQVVAQQFLTGISSIPYSSTSGVQTAIDHLLSQMPAKAGAEGKAAAAQMMLEWAQGLVDKGELPKNAIGQLIAGIERQFPALTSYLKQWDAGTSAQVAAALKLTQARTNLETTLAGVRQDFVGAGDVISKTVTAENLFPNLAAAMSFLKTEIRSSTGQAKQEAIAAMQQLQSGVANELGAMATVVATKTGAAKTVAAENFAAMTGSVAASLVKAGDATGAGMALIGQEMNKALKALGEPPISFTTVSSSPGAGGASLATLEGLAAAVPHGATGMRVNAPTYLVGEEAPGHHEYVLATNPAYRQRNVGLWAAAGHDLGIPGFAHGGVPGQITAPAVHGGGPAYHNIVAGALSLAAKDANAYLGIHAPAGGKGGTGFPVKVPGGLVGWLRAGMALAGVSGPLWLAVLERQAMRESSGQPGAINRWDINAQRGDPSEGLLQTTLSTFARYMVPGYGNILNPVDNTAAAILYMIATYGGGNPDLAAQVMWARGGGAYARGGIVGYATGGSPTGGPTDPRVKALMAKAKKRAPKPAKPKGLPVVHFTGGPASELWIPPGVAGRPSSSVFGRGGPFPFDASDIGPINHQLGLIFALDGQTPGTGSEGGAAQAVASLISWYTNLWSSSLYPPSVPGASDTFASWNSPPSFVLSTDALGQTVPPYVSPNLGAVIGELSAVIYGSQQIAGGGQTGLVADLGGALAGSQQLLPHVATAIARRVSAVKAITAIVKANIAKIKALQGLIAAEQKKKPPYAHPKTKAERDANAAFEKARKSKIAGWTKQIAAIEAQNWQLVGGKDAIPSPAGGELGEIQGQLGSPATGGNIGLAIGAGSAASGLYDLQSVLGGWITGLSGTGGDIPTQTLQLDEYLQGLSGLTGTGVSSALTAANLAANPTPTNPLTGTVAFTYQGQTYLGGMAMGGMLQNLTGPYGAIAALPAFGGSFALGGIVPGAPGEPRMIVAHGGETVTPAGGGATAAAMDRLTAALCAHEKTVKELTMATRQNTQATANSTSGGSASFTSGRPTYPPMLSSEQVASLHVGG